MQEKINTHKTSRRTFAKNVAQAGLGFMIVPRHVLGGKNYIAPSDRLNIVTIGAGGKGHSDTLAASGYDSEKKTTLDNIIGLCDVNDKEGARTFELFPKAKQYRDYRKMLDDMEKDIDAVIISTPDHMHCVQAMHAMKMGKHVYVQKPLAHDVYEARIMADAAKKYKVKAQMGNQGSSSDDIRRICEWIEAGTIGEVREVHCWTNRPVWEQGKGKSAQKMKVPAHLDWDLWLGTAPYRRYHKEYQPFNWRGWWDFGTGALGDMACHIMDPAVKALKLKDPVSVQAHVPIKKRDWSRIDPLGSPPVASMIYFDFPQRGELPPVQLTWYDGGLMPRRPAELKDDEMMGNFDGGVLFVGSKGKLMCDCYAANPRLLPLDTMKDFVEPSPTIPRMTQDNHQRNWVEAIKGNATLSSPFEEAGPFTEVVLMGNLAIRANYARELTYDRKGNSYLAYTGEGKKLNWDAKNMQITNYDMANRFVQREYREGWKI